MEHHLGLHFTYRTFHSKVIPQITEDDLYSMVGSENIAPGHTPLQRVEIVPAYVRETLKQAAANKPGGSRYENSHAL